MELWWLARENVGLSQPGQNVSVDFKKPFVWGFFDIVVMAMLALLVYLDWNCNLSWTSSHNLVLQTLFLHDPYHISSRKYNEFTRFLWECIENIECLFLK